MFFFFPEQPFYGNYSTLDSNTNSVISNVFASTRQDGVEIACSKRSDSGERCEVKIAMKSRGGLGRAFIFSRSFFLRTAPHYLNAWNRLVSKRSKMAYE